MRELACAVAVRINRKLRLEQRKRDNTSWQNCMRQVVTATVLCMRKLVDTKGPEASDFELLN